LGIRGGQHPFGHVAMAYDNDACHDAYSIPTAPSTKVITASMAITFTGVILLLFKSQ
jgi:hypothetical protein